MPITRPKQLADRNFYIEIMKTAYAIAEKDPPRKHYWGLMNSLLRSMDDKDFQGKWWHISYEENRFPEESEIFTLGVEFNDDYSGEAAQWGMQMKPELQIYQDANALPGLMKWCIYDNWWLPSYYREKYPEYEADHYNYWFGGGVLRKEFKPEYLYEGPAAYVEGFTDVNSVVTVRPSVRPYTSNRKRDAREALRRNRNNILIKKTRTVSRVGSRRGRADDSNVSTDYRPGSAAKILGKLQKGTPPIEIDMILPVFKQVTPVPTYRPIPYGFQVLKPGYSDLERFLSWLSGQQDLNGIPPEGTEEFLEALRFLVNGVRARAAGSTAEKVNVEYSSHISGRGLRYYGYNHKFNKGAFENEFKERLWEWYKVRPQRCYQQKVLDGPGWLQEPALFSNEPKLERIKITEKDASGKKVVRNYYVLRRDKETWRLDEKTHKVPVPDSINGGTAYRVYVNIAHNASLYYVINSRGQIVLNGGSDPTLLYNQYFPSGSGGNMNVWNPGGYDGSRGPTRL